MKFNIINNTLLIISTAYAYNLSTFSTILHKRELKIFNDAKDFLEIHNPFEEGVQSECLKDFKPYFECIGYPSLDDIEGSCEILASEECLNALTKPESVLPSCNGSEFAEIKILFNLIGSLNKFLCLQDEDGESCAMSLSLLKEFHEDKEVSITDEKNLQSITSTCLSESCRKGSYESLLKVVEEGMKVTTNEINASDIVELQFVAQLLNSTKCETLKKNNTTLTVNDLANANNTNSTTPSSNGAYTLKFVNSLLIALGLFLFYLY